MVEFPASALDQTYSNPLPHVLILTAIVVGVATLAVGLALVVLIREAYGTIEEEDINRAEYDAQSAGGGT
jgi:multicomponent Na+:H+ antiporter subunit C